MNQKKWVEWKHFGDSRSLFYINGAKVPGVFSSQGTPPEGSGTSIGGRFDGSRALKVGMSALEIYVGSKSRLPDLIRNLMISSQMIKNEVIEELLPRKRIWTNQRVVYDHVTFRFIKNETRCPPPSKKTKKKV